MYQGSGGFQLKTKGTERNEGGLDRGGRTKALVAFTSKPKGQKGTKRVWIEGGIPRLW